MSRMGCATLAGLLGLLGAACRPEPSTTDQATSRAALASPREAVDLDPDPEVLHVRLAAGPIPGGAPFDLGYEGMSPGPTLRARVGDWLVVDLENGLDDPTTIHWHGVRVPYEMDGVTWDHHGAIPPGGRFTYRFQLTHPGTFWYHPHFDTHGQVDRGLYGALIVEDPKEPRADEEWVLHFDIPGEHVEGAAGAHGHGRLRPRWRVNGVERPTMRARGGQVIRARLINTSSAGYLALRAPELRQLASDQGLLPELATPERLVLGPGDRAELEWRIGATDFVLATEPYSLNGGAGHGDPEPLLTVAVDQPADAPDGLPWPFVARDPSEDPGFTDVLYALAGSDRSGVWMIDGERFPKVTIRSVPLGSEPILELRNLSPTEHTFHLHGLTFEVLSVNGAAPPRYTLEDTLNLKIRDLVRLKVHADNPGDWMAHCHILPHAEEGMMTVLRVE